MKVEEGEVIYR